MQNLASLASLAKWLIFRLRTNWFWVRVQLQSINFSMGPYCTLLFSRKENFKFVEVALPAVFCNGAIGCIMNV